MSNKKYERRGLSRNEKDRLAREDVRSYADKVNDYRRDFIHDAKSSLLPKGKQEQGTAGNNNYDKVLADLDKKYQGRMDQLGNAFAESMGKKDKELGDINKRVKMLGDRNKALGEHAMSTSERLKGVYAAMAKMGKNAAKEEPVVQQDPMENFDATSAFSTDNLNEKPADTPSETTDTETTVVTGVVEGTDIVDDTNKSVEVDEKETVGELSVGQVVKVGDYELTITNKFGMRVGDNDVEGRTGQHSRGVDYTAGGRVVAIDDGIIQGVYRQGTGEVYHPKDDDKASAGYYIRVLNVATGITTDYMHMDKISDEEREKLMGKKISRGDSFWTAVIGSGSQTGPHVKVSQWKNYKDRQIEREQYDPSEYILKNSRSSAPARTSVKTPARTSVAQNQGNESLDHQVRKIMRYELERGDRYGRGLSNYGNPNLPNGATEDDAVAWFMKTIGPKLAPYETALEKGAAGDFIYNTGKDPRAYAIQEYYRKYDPSKLDAAGNWAGRGTWNKDGTPRTPISADLVSIYASTVARLGAPERVGLINSGRNWYYSNIDLSAAGERNRAYDNTWYGRIINTANFDDYYEDDSLFSVGPNNLRSDFNINDVISNLTK